MTNHTSKTSRLLPLTGAVAAAVLLSACGSMMSSPSKSMYSQDSLPDSIKVPAGNKVAMETVGVGEITYECRDKANMPGQTEWVFVGPKAVLNDRSGEQVGICEELDAVLAGHLGEGCRVGVFAEQYAVSGEELDVTNHGVATWEFGENGGVLSSCCGADAVVAPIHGCDAIGAHAAMACGAHRRGALAELGE